MANSGSFLERELREKGFYERKKEKEYQPTVSKTETVGDSTSKKSSGSSLLDKTLDEFGYKKDTTDSDGILKWFDDAKSAMNATRVYRLHNSGKYNPEYGGTNATKIRELLDSSSDVETYLRNHKDEIENYDALSKSFSEYSTALRGIDFDNYRMRRYYSQWESEDDYNEAVAKQKDYEEKSKFDIDAAQTEIDSYNDRLKELYTHRDSIQQKITAYSRSGGMGEKVKSLREELNQVNAEIKELEGITSEKTAYRNQAKRIQEGIALAGVADPNSELYDPDFEKYSGYVDSEHTDKLFGFIPVKDEDITYEYINANEKDREAMAVKYGRYLADNVISKGYDKLNEDETAIYNYYYAKEGKEAAEKYLENILESLSYRTAEQIHGFLGDSTALKLTFGVVAGLDQFSSGMKGLGSAITGEDDYIATSAYQIASGMVREDLADSGPNLPKWMGGASIGQVAYDSITTTSNMLPSIIASTAANFVVPGSGGAVGSVLLGSSAAGNAYQEMLNLGYDKNQARSYAALTGASEAGLQYLLGGISALGGGHEGIFQSVSGKILKSVDNAFARTAIMIGGNMLDEGLEEGLQEILTPWFKSLTLHVDEDINWDEVAYSTLLGALTAGFMEGPSTISGEVNTYRSGRKVTAVDGAAQRLAEIGNTFSADSVAYQLAGKVNENTGAYTIGRLFNEIGATMTEQNISDITQSLVSKGWDENIARKNAQVMSYIVNGGEISDIQMKMIEKNPDLAKTMHDEIIDKNSTIYQRMSGFNEAMRIVEGKASTQSFSTETTAEAPQENAETEGNLTADEKTASESVYEASADGKTILKNSDGTTSDVEIEKIESSGNGKMTLKLTDGRTVNASDVAYSSEGEALVYSAIADMGVNTSAANVLLDAYKVGSGVNAYQYSLGIREAYRYGQYNYDVNEVSKAPFSSMLTEHQRNTAYKLGKLFAVKEVAKQTAAIRQTKNGSSAKLEAKQMNRSEGKYQMVYFVGETPSAKARSGELEVIDLISSGVSGTKVHVYESFVDPKTGKRYANTGNPNIDSKVPNGMYVNGEIWLDLAAGNKGEGIILNAFSHELSHHIKKNSPAGFKKLANFLNAEYGKKGISVDERVRTIMEERNLGYSDAYEEFVANSMETMLNDPGVYDKIQKLKQQDKGLVQMIKDFIGRCLAKIREATSGKYLSLDGMRFAETMQDSMEQFQQLFAEALVDAGENYQASIAPGSEGTVYTQTGEAVAQSTDDGSVMLSMRTYEEEGRDVFRDYLQKCVSSKRITKAEMQEMLDGIEDIYNTCKEFKDKYAPFGTWSDAAVVRDTYGRPVFSVVTPNGEYKMNLDFSLVCKKRRTLDAVFNEMSQRGIIDNFELGQKSVVKINEIIRKHGFETACALCFVDAKRFRQASMADSFVRLYNELVNSLVPEESRGSIGYFNFSGNASVQKVENGIDTWKNSDLDFSHINQVMKEYGKGTVEYKSAQYIKNSPEARQLLQRGDFMSSGGFDAVKTQNKKILSLYNSKKGTGGPKAAFGDVQYMNEIVKKARLWTPAKAYAVGGVRVQSFSDYIPRMVFDYAQMVYDLAATKLPAHAYTKESLFAKQFGLTGIKINMSLIPAVADGGIAAGLDANGNYVWAGESFNYDDAVAIQNADGYTENCGTICVGVSDLHIRKLLNDPNIRMVIPYHKSGLNPIVAHMNRIAAFTDYTGSQNTLDRNGSKLSKDFDFNAELHKMGQSADPKAVIQKYLDWCDSNGYTPKFSQFRDHPNYYKLIEDFTLYDRDGSYVPQRDVRAVFPSEGSAFGSMKELIKTGLEEDAVIEGKRDNTLSSIVDEIEQTIPKTEAEIPETEVKQADRDLEAQSEYESKFSERVTDKETLDFLNNQETVTTYKTMQIVDGKLYPPMASRIEGKHEDYSVLGQWEAATEHPELMTKDGKFKLDKGKGNGSIQAAYNPYMHSSNLVLNDQFSGAYKRDNLVTVECEVPVSEVSSGYHAQYAKDSVGWHPWHTGTVAGQLRNATGTERQVFLSRWIKPVRIVPDAEVASMYKSLLNGTDIAVPDNVVTPSLLNELKKAGVPIKESGKVSDVKFSERKSYSRQVDEVKNNTHDRYNHVYMGTTPTGIANVLELPKLPMLVTSQHIYSMAVSKNQAKAERRYNSNLHYHELGWTAVKNLPEYMNKPVLIIKSNTDANDATFVVITAETDSQRRPIMAVVKPNGTGNYFNIEFPSNVMLSGYGRNGIQNYVARAKTENRILYANQKNSQKLKNTKGVQFSNNILASDYTANLAQFKQIVKQKFAGTIFENIGLPKFSERVSEKSVEIFGTTDNFNEAGYLLPNGKMLNFSNQNHKGERDYDHRAIALAYGKDVDLSKNHGFSFENGQYLDDFVEAGNIRFDAGDPGLNMDVSLQLSSKVPLTKEQEMLIYDLVEWNKNREEMFVTTAPEEERWMYSGPLSIKISFGGDSGYTPGGSSNADMNAWGVKYLSYDGGKISAKKIIQDIRHFYETGETNQQYELSKFLYSERTDDSVSNRSLLANAFEGIAQNDYERQKIHEYKEKVDHLDSEERKLGELNAQIRELSFAKGPRDSKKIQSLRDEATMTANRISTLDRALLRLEASKPLQNVLDREKKMAYKRAEQKGKEAMDAYKERVAKTQRELLDRYQQSRKNAVDSRNRTVMRHKIQNTVKELNDYLLHGTKDRHVPIELQKAVAEALDAVNMDTVGAEERIRKLQMELAKAKTPEKIDEISRKISNVQAMGDKMNGRLRALKDAYDAILNSDDPLIANSHDEVISNKLQSVIESVGNTPLRDMTLAQLEDVHDMYRAVLTTIRNANKAFKAAKSESISILGNRVMMEVEKAGGKKRYRIKGLEGISSFSWNNLKPVYAFEAIGSETFSKIFDNVRNGEDVWAVDVEEAKQYYLSESKKYGYDSWDFKKRYTFTSSSGMDFSLSIDQIMSLYAFSKREQAAEHLKKGGIVIDETTEVTMKTKLGIPVKFNPTEATAYNISDEVLSDIISKLTDEQKGFVDEMQDYLSTVMGAKGNDVSLEMYGIKLFKEKNYFPLKSAQQFMAKAKEQAQGEVKIKNSGFSKDTVRKASNPIVLTPFMNVWANHVNDMSMYHAFVLPMEDFYRVYNYKTPVSDTMATESVEMFLQNAYGKGATRYIDQLLKDLNGGARSDPNAGVINKMMGKFKKGAVFASASVVIQQPSAIARATALIDTKYFIGPKVDKQRHDALWSEVKKYAPVALIKEMGYFDTNMGKSTVDYITSKEYSGIGEKAKAMVTDSGYRDEVLSKAPALADEYTWCAIWEAVKRETKAKNPGMDIKSDAFLKKAGERFTEVIVKTQVYDSVLSRSGMMRSNDSGMKMVTAFMAEPTTSINMIQDALIKGKRGDVRYARKAIGSVIASVILNSIMVSFVYAGRDDDEDKTYLEKYITSFTSEMLEGLNPATYIPFIKDIVSIVQGYDVERSDMSVISDLWKSYERLSSGNLSAYRKVEDFAGSIAKLFGLPVKNIMRDARAIYQTVNSFMNGQQTTKAGVGYAVKEALPEFLGGGEVSKQQQLYEAYISGDKTQISRVESRYKDQNAVRSAIRKALRENDSRIHEAAQARIDEDLSKYTRLAKEIIAEGHFTKDEVVAAIYAEIDSINSGESTSTTSSKSYGLYDADAFAVAIADGDQAMANAVKTDIIQTAQKNGKTAEEAEKSFNSSAKSSIGDLFVSGDITKDRASKALVSYCGYEQSDADDIVTKWEYEKKTGTAYDDMKDEFMSGNLSESQAISARMEYGGVSQDDAEDTVSKWKYEKETGVQDASTGEAKDYYEFAKLSGIDADTYHSYYEQKSGIHADVDKDGKAISGSRKKKILLIINSLPLSIAQKDALYYAEGWAASTLREAPWH